MTCENPIQLTDEVRLKPFQSILLVVMVGILFDSIKLDCHWLDVQSRGELNKHNWLIQFLTHISLMTIIYCTQRILVVVFEGHFDVCEAKIWSLDVKIFVDKFNIWTCNEKIHPWKPLSFPHCQLPSAIYVPNWWLVPGMQ